MTENLIHRFWHLAKPVLRGSAVLTLITSACYGLQLNFAAAAFLYLVFVVLHSLDSGFVAAALVSVLAVACLDYFFIEPLFSFTVAEPLDILALLSFLVTSLVITHLASKARREANVSRLQRQNMERLYELAQKLLALAPENGVSSTFLEPFTVVFGLKAACLFDAGTAELHTTGNPQDGFGEKVRQAYILGRDSDDLPARTSLRSLRVAGRTTGAIGFEGLDDPELMAGPLATLAAASLERERAFRTVSDAAAQAKIEVFRAAILDAIAHEFKTPLATILTAAGGLREAGPLGREQEELADLVETETVRLGSLTSRLLRMARLDREEIKLRTERLDIRTMVEAAVDRYSRLSPDRRFSIVQTTEPDEVIADAELLRLAFNQLLDNARKYSSTGSEIAVEIGMQNHLVSISVRNNGCSIPSDERTRIFERYFRGTEGRRLAPGSGLGLYVARKIAVAHGGSLDLVSEDTARDGVAFRLTVPASRSESDLAGTSH